MINESNIDNMTEKKHLKDVLEKENSMKQTPENNERKETPSNSNEIEEEQDIQKADNNNKEKIKEEGKEEEAKKKKLSVWEKMVRSLAKRQILPLEQECEDFKQKIDSVEQELNNSKQEVERLNASLESKEKEAKAKEERLEHQISFLDQECKTLKQKIESTEQVLNNSKDEAERLRVSIGAKEKEVKAKEEELQPQFNTLKREELVKNQRDNSQFFRENALIRTTLNKLLNLENLTDVDGIVITDNMTVQEDFELITEVLRRTESSRNIQATEISNLKEKLDESRQRVMELEANESGQLILQLEESNRQIGIITAEHDSDKKMIEEKEATIIQKVAQITAYNEQIENIKKEKENVIKQKDSDIDELKLAHQSELELRNSQLKQKQEKHAKEIEKLKVDNKDAISKLNEEHEKAVNNLKADFTAQEILLNDKCQATIVQLNCQYQSEQEQLNRTLVNSKTEIEQLKDTLAQEAGYVKVTALDYVHRLVTIIHEGGYVKACSSDYTDSAEEKIYSLTEDVDLLEKAIEKIQDEATPSAQQKTITELLIGQLEKRSGVINRILQYYCFSNMPFMIDSERTRGLCFDRRLIKCIYDLTLKLLGLCGITPQIPALFAENFNEGPFEEDATFNDVETFCPGSIKNHISHVERNQRGLDNLLIGVTQIGYTLRDGTVTKGKVII